jgi:CheY-like chemotaxis protein
MDVRTWTVCLIEPNKFEGQIMLDLLKNAGVEKVKVFTTPADALDLLEIYNANVIVASYEMSPQHGAAWTKEFRRNRTVANRKASIFITSGAFSRTMAEECRHAGANALIGKPISGKVLTATINKVLTQPREFIDAEGYVGPCRRAGIVTAGAPRKRRKADDSVDAAAPEATGQTLDHAVAALAASVRRFIKGEGADACEVALRNVQAYAVNAGDGPLMRACASLTLQLQNKYARTDVSRTALEACVGGMAHLAALPVEQTQRREEIVEGVRQAVGRAAMQRAA